jgi:hypothetical protein
MWTQRHVGGRVSRASVFTGWRGTGLRPPTRCQKAALGLPSEAFAQAGRRAKGYGRSGRTARYGPPPALRPRAFGRRAVASAEGDPQAGEGVGCAAANHVLECGPPRRAAAFPPRACSRLTVRSR